MHSGDITIENITKIEGHASLKVKIENDKVSDIKFIIADYKRFYTTAVLGKMIMSVPSFLSRICGTCSVAHLFASITAIEKSQGIEITEQTKLLRRLAYDALMLRDHALHLYFFVLPDILGLDSILDIPDVEGNLGHILLHDSFDMKRLGSDIANEIIGAAIHAPFPTIGGFLRTPDKSRFPDLISRLEKLRPQVLRGIKIFYEWDEVSSRESNYLCLRNDKDKRFDFLNGDVLTSEGKRMNEKEFREHIEFVQVPYSNSESYVLSDNKKDYMVGALARINLNKDLLQERTKKDTAEYLKVFPSNNIQHNNLAQAIEILQSIDEAIEILKAINITDEKPIKKPLQAGEGIGLVEAPRGILYHRAKVNEQGIIEDYDVIVPTTQNQINIENNLKEYFNKNLDKDEATLHRQAEKIVRAYDPCMSCATNFLKIDFIRE